MPGRHTAEPPKRARRATRRSWRSVVLIAAGCTLVLLVALGVRSLIGSESSAADGCAEEPVSLVVTPEMGPVVEAAAEHLHERGCVQLEVDTMTAAALLQQVESGESGLPDLWIPDASTWFAELPRSAVPDNAAIRRFAKTPVVLVGPEGTPRPRSWLGAMGTEGASLPDPRRSSAALGTLAAMHGETISGATTGTDLARWLVDAAQRSAGGQRVSEQALYDRATTADAPALFPSTEQRFLARIGEDPDLPLTAVVPRTGSVLLDYPLAVLGGAGAQAAFEALGDYLGSAAGQQAVTAAGFRPPSGQAPQESFGVGAVAELGLVDATGVDRLLRQWVTLSVQTRMLAVIDVSGSMAEPVGDKTRMQLAAEAATASLRFMPDDAQVGLWAFSVELGADGRDYREVVPVGDLEAVSRGSGHRAALTAGVRSLPELVGGGTALYDSTLAAFRAVQDSYDPRRSNSVVLLTDGRNDDPDGLTLEQLLESIKRERDPARPVRVVTIGMGPEADTRALQRISELTGARSYVADDPRDIGTILTDALLERVGWGLR